MSTHSIRTVVQEEALFGLRSRSMKVTVKDRVTKAFGDWRHEMYRYALSIGLSPAQAQEITQDAFLRLYVSLDNGEDIKSQRAWLFRVVHNLALNLRVKEGHVGPWTPDLDDRLVDPGANPEQALLEQEKLRRLHRAVEGLSDQQRQCLHLRSEGLRYREIAAIIGIKTSTVSEFLKRAISRLRKARHEHD